MLSSGLKIQKAASLIFGMEVMDDRGSATTVSTAFLTQYKTHAENVTFLNEVLMLPTYILTRMPNRRKVCSKVPKLSLKNFGRS